MSFTPGYIPNIVKSKNGVDSHCSSGTTKRKRNSIWDDIDELDNILNSHTSSNSTDIDCNQYHNRPYNNKTELRRLTNPTTSVPSNTNSLRNHHNNAHQKSQQQQQQQQQPFPVHHAYHHPHPQAPAQVQTSYSHEYSSPITHSQRGGHCQNSHHQVCPRLSQNNSLSIPPSLPPPPPPSYRSSVVYNKQSYDSQHSQQYQTPPPQQQQQQPRSNHHRKEPLVNHHHHHYHHYVEPHHDPRSVNRHAHDLCEHQNHQQDQHQQDQHQQDQHQQDQHQQDRHQQDHHQQDQHQQDQHQQHQHQQRQHQHQHQPSNKRVKTNKSDIIDLTIPKSWDENCKRLIEYKQKHNSCRIELRLCGGDQSFQKWVHKQRSFYINKTLSKERRALLNSIGLFERKNRLRKIWEENYKRLVAYKQKHNSFRIELRLCDGDKSFPRWINTERSFYKNNRLSKERIALLNSIGFSKQTTRKDKSIIPWGEKL
jgi:hypothetical protein